MKNGKKVLVVCGTRPDAIKLAPVVKSLAKRGICHIDVAFTAQHRELLDQVKEIFGLEQAYDLNAMRSSQSLAPLMSRLMSGLHGVLQSARPDFVLVQGDTTTTLAGALAGFYSQISVGHVEAGLRTFDRRAPYPEEVNRRLTSTLAEYHFAPTPLAESNLHTHGVPAESVFVTGNTVVDAVRAFFSADYSFKNPNLRELQSSNHRIVLGTLHRREAWERIPLIADAAARVVTAFPKTVLVMPMHPNPALREPLQRSLGRRKSVVLTEALPYDDFVNLLARSYVALTDSGGVQEEAPALGTPVVVARDRTERPEGVESGISVLAGAQPSSVSKHLERILASPDQRSAMVVNGCPYGDGRAGERIAQVVEGALKGEWVDSSAVRWIPVHSSQIDGQASRVARPSGPQREPLLAPLTQGAASRMR